MHPPPTARPTPQRPTRRPAVAAWALVAGLVAAALPGAADALSEERRFTDFAIDNWTVADGLPQVSVQALGQDGDGYVWVGTQGGIARFDGVRFERFDRRRAGGIDTSMPESGFRDSQGHVWFGTRQGALRLRGDHVERLAASGTALPVQAIAEWPAGRLVFGTPQGLHEASTDGRLVPLKLEGTDVGALLAEGTVLWAGTPGRLLRFEGSQVRPIDLPGGAGLRITHLLADGAVLWIGTPHGLWRMDGDLPPARVTEPGLAQGPIEALCADSGGSLWVGTPPRLFRRHGDGRVEAVADTDFVRNAWVNACFEDREGNLWLGSHTEGLFRLWDGLIARLTERDGLGEPFVWSLEQAPGGGVLLGTNRGLYRWQPDGGVRLVVPAGDLPDPAVYELAAVGDRVWIGTRGGLVAWDGRRLAPPPGAERLAGLQVNTVTVAADGLWVGTSGGLFRTDGPGPLRPVATVGLPGASARVRSLWPLGPGRALVGTEAGLRLVEGETVSTPAWAAGLDDRMITTLLGLDDGRILIGTLDSGLAIVAGERLQVLDARGLSTSAGTWSLRVVDGWVYASSSEGLFRLPVDDLPDPRSPARREAPTVDWVVSMDGRNQSGQRARCCNGGARSRTLLVGRELWLPSISGVLRVDIAAVGLRGVEPLVRIEGARQGERREGVGDAPFLLAEGPRDLRVDFTALHFRNPRAVRFEYRLEGYDTDWIDAGDRRSAFYTNLPPGDFRFRVRALDGRGQRIQAGNVLSVVVTPRWHERQDVRALLGLLGIGLIGGGVGLALRAQRRQTARLKAMVDDRTAQLRRSNERLQQANEALALESQTDSLTGLPNRRALFQQMPDMLARHPEGVVMALVDLDHFKRVNDEFGHAAGDLVLREFAAFLRRTTREGDLLARWGGEEFLVVFGGLTPAAAPARVAQLLESGRALHLDLGGRTVYPAFSVGWTRHPLDRTAASDWVHALELADAALYDAKARGRGTWSGLVPGPGGGGDALQLGPQCGTRVAEMVADGRLAWLRPETAERPGSGRGR